jgi:hypothetical protein
MIAIMNFEFFGSYYYGRYVVVQVCSNLLKNE